MIIGCYMAKPHFRKRNGVWECIRKMGWNVQYGHGSTISEAYTSYMRRDV